MGATSGEPGFFRLLRAVTVWQVRSSWSTLLPSGFGSRRLCSALFLVQQRIHVRHQSTRPFWKNFTLSYAKGGLSDPEVDPRPHDCCKLWTLRSCSSSLSSTSLSLRKEVDVGCAGVVACPLCAATDCGRRCDAAATSSSCRPQQLE